MSSKRNATQQFFSRSFLFFLIVANFSMCSQKEANPEQKLLGTWNRTDGDYFLVINQVEEEGQLEVEYLERFEALKRMAAVTFDEGEKDADESEA
jgi:hypothetical protein